MNSDVTCLIPIIEIEDEESDNTKYQPKGFSQHELNRMRRGSIVRSTVQNLRATRAPRRPLIDPHRTSIDQRQGSITPRGALSMPTFGKPSAEAAQSRAELMMMWRKQSQAIVVKPELKRTTEPMMHPGWRLIRSKLWELIRERHLQREKQRKAIFMARRAVLLSNYEAARKDLYQRYGYASLAAGEKPKSNPMSVRDHILKQRQEYELKKRGNRQLSLI